MSLKPSETFTITNYWTGETRTSHRSILRAEAAFAEILSFLKSADTEILEEAKVLWHSEPLSDLIKHQAE